MSHYGICAGPPELTWTLLDAERPVGVLGAGVVLQLERGGVVHERLRALGHTRPAVVEVGAGLQEKHSQRSDEARRGGISSHYGNISSGMAAARPLSLRTPNGWENWSN